MSSLYLRQSAPTTVPRLSGRRLLIARSVWLLVCGSAVIAFVAALPYRWALLMNPSLTNLANLDALGLTPTFFAGYSLFWELVIVLPSIVVGIFIFLRCGEQRIALLTSLVLIVFYIANGTLTPTLRAILGVHPALDLLQHTLEFIAWYSFALFFYLFPTGRFVPGWTRWAALALLPIFLLWNYAEDSPLSPPNWPQGLFMTLFLLQLGSWVYSQVYRYRRVSGAVERQQTKLVVYAVVITLAIFILTGTISAFIPGYNLLVEEQPTPQSFAFMLGSWLTSPVMMLLPVSIAFSIVRYRLWDIDLLINRTLVYGLLTISTIGIYIFVVGYLGSLIQQFNRSVIAFLATGLIAVLFQPLRLILQRAVNRLMYGERDDPYAVLSRLHQRLDLTLTPGSVLPSVLETIIQALKIPYAAIHMSDQIMAMQGNLRPNTPTEIFPLVYQGEIIGQLEVALRALDENFTPGERRLLADIAHQIGIAAYNVRLNAELQSARERLVNAREEERRRLRRDLHDGLGPRLAGQALILEAVRDTLEPGSPTQGLVDHLITDSQTIVAEVRELVHGLRPPALDEHGLDGALRLLVAKYESSKLHITITTPEPMHVLPAAVEVATYRVAQEALTNVVRHSQAQNCKLVLTIDDDVELEITDDGVGLPPTRQSGVGLSSMRERAEEIGGNFSIKPGKDRGTQIIANFPIEIHGRTEAING